MGIIRGLRRTLANIAFDRGGAVSVVALVAYVWLAPAHIVDGDNAEFATLGTLGGVAHPSGYPLYLLWLRAWSWLPSASPAHTAALATAILAVLQLVVLHAACRAWGARAAAASIAVAIYAAAPIVLRVSTEAEVFALNGLAVATVMWLAAERGPAPGAWRVALLGLVAGLGLANHLTCVLVAPVGLLGVVRGVRESALPRPLVLALPVATLALGLTPYLYLLVTRETLLSWRSIDGFGDLVNHFLRKDYGPVGQFSPRGSEVAVTTSLAVLAQTIGRGWLWVPALVALGVVIDHVRRAIDGYEGRWGWATLGAAFLIAGPLLVTQFNVPPESVGLFITQRFHLLPMLLLAPAVAVGIDRLGKGRLAPRSGAAIAVVVFVGLGASSLPRLASLHSPAVERGLVNALRSVPPNAVIIGSTDVFHFGMGYLQAVRAERPDVTIIAWPQIPSPHYRARLARRAGIAVAPNERGIHSVDVARQILATGRPLFIDAFGANIARELSTYPYGVLFRVLPDGVAKPSVAELFAINKRLFEGFVLDYPVPGTDDQFATELHWLYARVWVIIGDALRAEGKREDAAVADAFVEALRPRE